MAHTRNMPIDLCNEEWFLGLSLAAKGLYCYLRINPRTNLAGLYLLPLRVLLMETGATEAELSSLLEEIGPDHVRYADGVCWMVGVREYELGMNPSPKVRKSMDNDVLRLPESALSREYRIRYGYPIDTVSIGYRKGTDTPESLSLSPSVSPQVGEGTGTESDTAPAPAPEPAPPVVAARVGQRPMVAQAKAWLKAREPDAELYPQTCCLDVLDPLERGLAALMAHYPRSQLWDMLDRLFLMGKWAGKFRNARYRWQVMTEVVGYEVQHAGRQEGRERDGPGGRRRGGREMEECEPPELVEFGG